MLKNITRQLLAQLGRRLPRRLIARDPLPDGKILAGAPMPETLSRRCLDVADMDEREIWRAFNSHPEGLNPQEVEASRQAHGENVIPAQKPAPWWAHLWRCYRNPFNLLLTLLGVISYATEDLFAAGVIALMVAIATLLNFVQEALHQSGGCAEGDGQQHRHRPAGHQRSGREPLGGDPPRQAGARRHR